MKLITLSPCAEKGGNSSKFALQRFETWIDVAQHCIYFRKQLRTTIGSLYWFTAIWHSERNKTTKTAKKPIKYLHMHESRHHKMCLWEFPTRPDTNRPAQPQKLESLEISTIESTDIILSKQRTTKALIRLRGCAVWSAPLLFAYDMTRFLMARLTYKQITK